MAISAKVSTQKRPQKTTCQTNASTLGPLRNVPVPLRAPAEEDPAGRGLHEVDSNPFCRSGSIMGSPSNVLGDGGTEEALQ